MRYTEIITESIVTFYHGSKSPISKFTLDNLGSGTNIDQEGPGIYLTNSADDARVYGNYIHEVKVNLVKKRMMPDKKALSMAEIARLIREAPEWSSDLYTNWNENESKALTQATKAIMNSWGPNQYREAMEQIWYDYYRDYSKVYLNKMVELGWDGFLVPRSNGVQHLIVFNPAILNIKGMVQV